MSKFFRVFLQAKEPMLSATLRQLERRTGNKSIDIRYQADITARAHALMRRLGLDPADTTKNELYQTLNAHSGDDHLFRGTSDVALMFADGEMISFNVDDIAENTTKPFAKRSLSHARCRAQEQLIARYVAAKKSDSDALKALYKEAGLDNCSLAAYHKTKRAEPKKLPKVLCIGDIFTDVFIKLAESEARIDTDPDGSKRLSLPFGSKPPYDGADIVHSVGPSPNAAVSMARLGVDASLMSWLGNDQVGRASLEYLAHEKVDTTSVVVQKKIASNTYYVLRYGADRTILVKNEAYRYDWKAPKVTPDWVYLSLLSADSWPLHQELIEYLEANPQIKFAFQPGTFHFKWGTKKLRRLYKRTEIVVLNREEAVDVTAKSYDSIKDLADALHALGPKIVVITDGPNGSYASYDEKLVKIDNYPDPAKPLDRTGAGDAFASTIVAALAHGETIDTALLWAPINSMNVVQKLGAQAGLLKRSQIKKYLEQAPKNYKIKELK